MSAESLADAVRQVAERQQAGRADPPTYEVHLQSRIGLDECNKQLDQRRREAAEPAA